MTSARSAPDRIHIRDLGLRCLVGAGEEERARRQDVVLNVTLYLDLGRPCLSDELEDTVDYQALQERITANIEGQSFRLIERLAGAVAEICLESSRIERVDVAVDKPGALAQARSVAVELTRVREG